LALFSLAIKIVCDEIIVSSPGFAATQSNLEETVRVQWREPMIFATAHARGVVVAAAMIVIVGSPASALQAPGKDCRQASKIEYESAKHDYLQTGRFGSYVRTGRLWWRRHYWYCYGD
jgi:hypothetical protein